VTAVIDTDGMIWRSEHPFAGPWLPIGTAPRDARVIEVSDLDTAAAEMWWNATGTNPLVQEGAGIWEAVRGDFTWSEAAGAGPTHWRPCSAEMPAFLLQLGTRHGG